MLLVTKIINKIESILTAFVNNHIFGAWGKNTSIQKPLKITAKKNIFIGHKVLIMPLARIEPIISWKDSNGTVSNYNPKLIIEDGVSAGQCLHINCAQSVIIHKDCLISSFVFISDIDHEYGDINVPVGFQPLLIQPVEIGEQTFIGTGVKILAGSHIGKHCIVGANSVVSHDIPDYSVVVGIPAKIIKKYDFKSKSWIKV